MNGVGHMHELAVLLFWTPERSSYHFLTLALVHRAFTATDFVLSQPYYLSVPKPVVLRQDSHNVV